MKILYVKNNSERSAKFQLKTIIYEEDGKKYVKKQAITKEAIPHLKKMKDTYIHLLQSIVNPHIKLSKIIEESDNSLTFEYIDGISVEKKFNDAYKVSHESAYEVIDEYIHLLKNGFKTTLFNTSMITEQYKDLFGQYDFTNLNQELCFEGVSNIDLIFSNLIYKNDDIYIIDYEWAYEVNIPINYILYRPLTLIPHISENFLNHFNINTSLYKKMERYFVDNYVMHNGFYFQKNQYIKKNSLITKQIEQLKSHVIGKETHIQELSTQIHDIGENLSYARSIIDLRDNQIQFLNYFIESLNLKNRLKHAIKKYIPISLLKLFNFTKNVPPVREDFPNTIEKKEIPFIYKYHTPVLENIIKEELENFTKKPLISIIMPVYNVDPKWLSLAIQSIENQWYTNWELCISDDKSTNSDTVTYLNNITNPKIKIIYQKENLNISGASNSALTLSTGEYIALMDNDDEITPNALFEIVKAINETDAEFIYSDEDFITTEGECLNPHFKPDFSPNLLLSHNYMTHLTCFKKDLLTKVGHFNPTFDGSQDYDLFLRLTEQTSNIYHIQKVLYHWRMLETSTSLNSDAKPEAIERGRQVLEATAKRRDIDANVVYGNLHHYFRIQYDITNNPLVSIIIPFKDKPELLETCIYSILEKSTYQNYEIIGISNNSTEDSIFTMMKTLEQKDKRVSFYEYNIDFNYSKINNHAVNTYAKGEHILLLNNDIEIISPDWIEAMLEHSQRAEVGCVGAKLYYPNDTIQHAGIIIGLGGYAGHSHKMYPRDNLGYFNRLNVVQNISAVTAACLMVKKSIYNTMNGLDEVNFKIAYNDVDFCLRVQEEGYLNIFTPYAEAYHHESISRGYESTPEKIARFSIEKDALFERHQTILSLGDPYYNPNLTTDKEDFGLCQK